MVLDGRPECATIEAMGHLTPGALMVTWDRFKATGDLSYRNELVVHYTSLVKYVANKIGTGLPQMVDREDLVSYGMFGLIDAIDKFDLEKGVKFETYSMARIRGAIYDEIRALDWVPRSVRSKVKDVEKARAEVEMTLGRPASHDEVAVHLGLESEEYWKLHSQTGVTLLESAQTARGGHGMSGDANERFEIDYFDPKSSPEEIVETGEIATLLGEAVNRMDERSKTILVLYYLQEMTLAEIGEILGVTESRVCQLQSKVLLALRESLGQGGLVAA